MKIKVCSTTSQKALRDVLTIINYLETKYNIVPEIRDTLHGKEYIFKHADTKRWFAVMIVGIDKGRLGIGKSTEKTNIINLHLKETAANMNSMQSSIEGLIPAYHMSREFWVAVSLDSTIDIQEIENMLDRSFSETKMS